MKNKVDILELYMKVEEDYSFDTRVRINNSFIKSANLDINKISELLKPLVEYIEDNV